MDRKTKFDILRLLIVGSGLETDEKRELVDFVTDYEKAEQNGMLIHLPCKVGNTVYLSNHDRVVRKKEPLVCIVDEFTMSDSECYAVLNANEPFYALHRFKAVNIKDFGRTIFLTREAAEQALKQMGE